MKLKKVDELGIRNCPYLTDLDKCFYWHEYEPRATFRHSKSNQFVWNYKKPLDANGQLYKQRAIQSAADLWTGLVEQVYSQTAGWPFEIVIMPTSKAPTDNSYDDRLLKTVEIAQRNLADSPVEFGFIEVAHTSCSRIAAHDGGDRLSPNDLASSWEIDVDKLAQISRNVIIFDDVLTTGSHFAALKQVIAEHQPMVEIRGVFLAKTNDLVDPFGLSG